MLIERTDKEWTLCVHAISPVQIHAQEKAFSVQFSGLYMFETDVHGKPTVQDFVEDPGQLAAPFSLGAARLQNQIQRRLQNA